MLGATGCAAGSQMWIGMIPAFTPNPPKKSRKTTALEARRQDRGQQMEIREVQAAAHVTQQKEGDQQQTGARMGHDEEQRSSLAGLSLSVLETDQAIRRQRHHFPGQKEEERVRGRENQRQTGDQDVVKKTQQPYPAAVFFIAQVSPGIDRYGGRQQPQRQAEKAREPVQAHRPAAHRQAARQAPKGVGTPRQHGRRRKRSPAPRPTATARRPVAVPLRPPDQEQPRLRPPVEADCR